MRTIEIETWALRVIAAAVAGQASEDSRVELKTTWPADHQKAARRIAAHANAAHGEPILWLIGVNEGLRSVPGATAENIADWRNNVSRYFDEVTPEMRDVIVTHETSSVVALLFQTDRAPYVVTANGAGGVDREVPFRVGTGVGSIHRSQLVRLLDQSVRTPTIEVMSTVVAVSLGQVQGQQRWNERWYLNMRVFIVQPQGQESVFSDHRTTAKIFLANGDEREVSFFTFAEATSNKSDDPDLLPALGPCRIAIAAEGLYGHDQEVELPAGDVRCKIEFDIPNCLAPIRLDLNLVAIPNRKPRYRSWGLAP